MLRNFPRRFPHISSWTSIFLHHRGFASLSDLYPPPPPASATAAFAVSSPTSVPPSAASSPIPTYRPPSQFPPKMRRSSSFVERALNRRRSSSAQEALVYARKGADMDTFNVPDFWEPSPPRKMSEKDPKRRSVHTTMRPPKFVPPPNMPPLTYSSSTTTLNTFSPKESVYTNLAPPPRKRLPPMVEVGPASTPPFDPPPPVHTPEGPFAPILPPAPEEPEPASSSSSRGHTNSPLSDQIPSRIVNNTPPKRSMSTATTAAMRRQRKNEEEDFNRSSRKNGTIKSKQSASLPLQQPLPFIAQATSSWSNLEQSVKPKAQKGLNKIQSQLEMEQNDAMASLWPSLDPRYPHALSSLGITSPTQIQADFIPLLSRGEDVELYSSTGSGKTLAWLLPIHCALQCELLQLQRAGLPYPSQVRCLVVAPSLELAYQFLTVFVEVGREVHRLLPLTKKKKAKRVDIEVCSNENERARNELEKFVATYANTATIAANTTTMPSSSDDEVVSRRLLSPVVICTPDALTRLLEEKIIDLNELKWIVVEETDEVLRGEHAAQVEKIILNHPISTQLVFSTATPTEYVKQLANKAMNRNKQSNLDINPNNNDVDNNNNNNTTATNERNTDDDNNDEITAQQHQEIVTSSNVALSANYNFPPSLRHYCISCLSDAFEDKQKSLLALLQSRRSSSTEGEEGTRSPALVFVDNERQVHALIDFLRAGGVDATSFSKTDTAQQRRETLMAIRLKQIDAVVVTEDMSRGLDLKGLSDVINLSVVHPIAYIHRAGRVARVGGWGQGLPPSTTFPNGTSSDYATSASVFTLQGPTEQGDLNALQSSLNFRLLAY